MIQNHILFALDAALVRHPGAELTTHLAPYEKRRGTYTVVEVRDADGQLVRRAVGPSKQTAMENLNTSFMLG